MVPLGLFPVLVAAIKIMLIHVKVVETLGVAPIPDTRHFSGVVGDKWSFNHSIGRMKRELKCRTGHYPHPNGTHCCIKCHPGTYVAQHCLGPGRTTNCSDCPDGTYMLRDNFGEKCRPCQRCRSTIGQILISKCTSKQDTVCGCNNNQYQTTDNSEFSCKDCAACHNGTILQQCTKSSNTLCACHDGFFLQTDDNTCSPCSSCSDGKCQAYCKPKVGNTGAPVPDSSDLKSLLASLVVLFGAGCVLLLARGFLKRSCWKQHKPTQKPYPSVQQSGHSVPKGDSVPKTIVAVEDKKTDFLLEPSQKVVLLPHEATPVSLPSQELPDCVKSAGETQIPDCHAVLYTIVDHVPVSQWKEFVRRLGLKENTIERIQMEQRHVREAQYEMLRQWRLQAGRGATVERISNVLNQMELSGCSEAIQEVLPKQP